jgi:branched-chain amino acid transport system ATP-binding protein
MTALLETRGLSVFYGDFQAVFGVDVRVEAGETLAIIGANGAGKSSLLKALAGLARVPREQILLDGTPVGGTPAFDLVKRGVALVPEGRRLFPSLNVEENILMGANGSAAPGPWSLEALFRLFPILKERRRQMATTLSGGQQQLVALARALMANPRLLLCDEISLGLSPAAVRDVYGAFPAIRENGTTVVIVEQDLSAALAAADRVVCLMEGRVTLEGRPGELTRDAIHHAYFGD